MTNPAQPIAIGYDVRKPNKKQRAKWSLQPSSTFVVVCKSDCTLRLGDSLI